MPVIRQIALALAVGAPCLLLTSRPHFQPGRDEDRSTAHAEGATATARIDMFLPPARVSPPVALPAGRPRRRFRPAPPAAPASLMFGSEGDGGPAPVAPPRPRPRPGLFTVSRIGRRLLYRKGYLGEIPVHLVIADLNDPEIKIGVMVARGGIGTSESFESMVGRSRPAAALTGTFFGLNNRLPTGDLVVNGRAVYQGFVGTAVAFTEGNVVSFIPTGYKEKTAWRFFDGVLRAGPLLLREGQIAVGPREEGFVSLSPAARRSRTAVGITSGRKLLLLAVKEPVSLWRLAKLMRELGAFHAVAMDGGTSTGLYFRGQMVARPGRALTNALVIYAYQRGYLQAKRTFLMNQEPAMKWRPRLHPLPPRGPAASPAIALPPATDPHPAPSPDPREPIVTVPNQLVAPPPAAAPAANPAAPPTDPATAKSAMTSGAG